MSLIDIDVHHIQYSPVCHARRIVGISVTNAEQYVFGFLHLDFAEEKYRVNLINSIQPLFIAACHLPNSMEKAVLLDFLANIEKRTGWKTSEEVEKLQMIWKTTVLR